MHDRALRKFVWFFINILVPYIDKMYTINVSFIVYKFLYCESSLTENTMCVLFFKVKQIKISLAAQINGKQFVKFSMLSVKSCDGKSSFKF